MPQCCYYRGLVLMPGISQRWLQHVKASSEPEVGSFEGNLCHTDSHMHTCMCTHVQHGKPTAVHKCSFSFISAHTCTPISNFWLRIQIWFPSQRALLSGNLCQWNRVRTVLWLNLNLGIKCCNEACIGLRVLPLSAPLTDVLSLQLNQIVQSCFVKVIFFAQGLGTHSTVSGRRWHWEKVDTRKPAVNIGLKQQCRL